jgi:hypothetical protein
MKLPVLRGDGLLAALFPLAVFLAPLIRCLTAAPVIADCGSSINTMLSRVTAVAGGRVFARAAPAVARRSATRAACSLNSTTCGCCGRRHFSKKAAAAAGAPKSIPVNVLADGTDPVERPDAEYPDWLWQLTADKPSESELLDKGLDNLSIEELEM